MTFQLRDVVEDDLEIFFQHQRDAEAAAMAAYPMRGRDAFMTHWRTNVLGNAANITRTMLVDGNVAGYIGSWTQDNQRLVAYWIGREYWGRGVASWALDEFLRAHKRQRPMHAYVAQANTRSIRVLEKCGFEQVGEPATGTDGVTELLMRLSA